MNADPTSEIRSLSAGVRALSLVTMFILAYFNIRLAFQIGSFHAIFADMLGGRPLPSLTTFLMQARELLIILSLMIPLAGIGSIAFIRDHRLALYSLSSLMLLAFIQISITWTGLFAPLMSIVSGMQNQ